MRSALVIRMLPSFAKQLRQRLRENKWTQESPTEPGEGLTERFGEGGDDVFHPLGADGESELIGVNAMGGELATGKVRPSFAVGR